MSIKRSCPYCGNPIHPEDKYCSICGKPQLSDLNLGYEKEQKGLNHFFYNDLKEESSYNPNYNIGLDSERDFDINEINNAGIDEEIRYIEQKIETQHSQGNPLGDLFLEKGALYYKKRDFSRALKELETALKIFSEERDPLKIAITHNEIGLIKEKLGYFEDAIFHFNTTIDLLRTLNEPKKIVLMFNNIGNAYLQINDFENSYEYYQKAINLAEREQFIYEEVKSSSNLVEVLFFLKDYERVKRILQRNEQFFQKNNDLHGLIITKIKYGKLFFYMEGKYLEGGDYTKSYNSFSEALNLIEQMHNSLSIFQKSKLEWEIYLYLGKIEQLRDNHQKAESFLLKSMECVRLFETGEENLKEATILEELARVYTNSSEIENAIEYYLLAIRIHERFGEDLRVAELYAKIAQMHRDYSDDTLKAIEFYEKALFIYEHLGYYKELAKIYAVLGDIYLSKNITDVAMSNFQKAERIYNQLNDNYHIELLREKIASLLE
ncbi:MAG: Tetratricopeptide repeat protein [Promethearchaeota archaeon]|nr:MAG: Tetratricopeptide repeat protein [Candidatus Lokiarchaeota archaeon]